MEYEWKNDRLNYNNLLLNFRVCTFACISLNKRLPTNKKLNCYHFVVYQLDIFHSEIVSSKLLNLFKLRAKLLLWMFHIYFNFFWGIYSWSWNFYWNILLCKVVRGMRAFQIMSWSVFLELKHVLYCTQCFFPVNSKSTHELFKCFCLEELY